jgi:tetratricopeptide (TPR) repeat protein
MLSEETINKVFFISKQKYHRNIWKLTLLITISSIVCLGILCGLLIFWEYYNWINNILVAILSSLLLFITITILIVSISLIERIKAEKRECNRVKFFLTSKSKYLRSFLICGNILANYGFYEEALDDFNSALRELEKESEQIAESLQKFFEEYNTMTKFIDGIYRPVPNFRNYNLFGWDQCYQARKNCLEKLKRYDEAKADEEKLKTIAILTEENNNLTKKYWKDYGDRDYDYD